MIPLRVEIDTKALEHFAEAVARDRVPSATVDAINRTARKIRLKEQDDILRLFDRPTPYTQRALYVQLAVKSDPRATVWLKNNYDPRPEFQHYLAPNITGGGRRHRPFEGKLRHFGILPPGMFVVPGAACPLDAYGNIGRGLINQILSYLGASELVAGSTSNTSQRSRKGLERRLSKRIFRLGTLSGTLIVYRGNGDSVARTRYNAKTKTNVSFNSKLPAPGIWMRGNFTGGGDAIRPILIFVRAPAYKRRWDFYATAQRVVEERFGRYFAEALDQALRTAR